MKESKADKANKTKMLKLSDDDLMHVTGGYEPVENDDFDFSLYVYDVPDDLVE